MKIITFFNLSAFRRCATPTNFIIFSESHKKKLIFEINLQVGYKSNTISNIIISIMDNNIIR